MMVMMIVMMLMMMTRIMKTVMLIGMVSLVHLKKLCNSFIVVFNKDRLIENCTTCSELPLVRALSLR